MKPELPYGLGFRAEVICSNRDRCKNSNNAISCDNDSYHISAQLYIHVLMIISLAVDSTFQLLRFL